MFWSQSCAFWASPCKTMRNHSGILSESQFWTPIFLSNPFFSQTFFFNLQTTFFHKKTLFFRFLAQIRFRTPLKSPQKPSSRPQSCKSLAPAPCLKLQSGNSTRQQNKIKNKSYNFREPWILYLMCCISMTLPLVICCRNRTDIGHVWTATGQGQLRKTCESWHL